MKTAIIIGAGPAGLTTAWGLLQTGEYKPVILEESEYIGGISRTAEFKGNRMDLGGHRFFSKSDEVNKIWDELMPVQGAPAYDDKKLGWEKPLQPGGPDPEKEDRVMLIRNRVSRILYRRKFFDYPISMKFETIKNLGFGTTMKAGFGYLGSTFKKKPEDSLENFYINRFGRPLYSMFFEHYTEKVWGRHPSKISADWGSQRVKGLSLMKTVWNAMTKPFRGGKTKETSLIEQFRYPKRGPGHFYETMAEEIVKRGGEIHFNQKVTRLDLEDGRIAGILSEDQENGGQKTWKGDAYISSMPIRDLIRDMEGEVPGRIRELADGLPYRDFMTVGLLVKKLLLENKTKQTTLHGGVPDNWIYVQEDDVLVGRLQIFNNWSPYMPKDPEHTMWIGLEYFCDEGDRWWEMSDEDFIKLAISELVKVKVIDADDVIDACRIRVKKAYPAYFDTYEHFDEVREWLKQVDNLLCVGRNGQHRYNNMDHSMLTGLRAAEVLAGKATVDDVWNVNTETEYHENKESKES